ncbi:MAG: VOC family protein [Proteobacteria bacterium]|nr:VOC family protein [Pseudomonadota bacterium]
MELAGAKLRIARPTSDMAAAKRFYMNGLGLELLGSFEDHGGFDGITLGFASQSFHLEITYEHAAPEISPPSPEDLIVFYVEDKAAWQRIVDRMKSLGYEAVKSSNSYWDVTGITFADPDGFRVVLENAASGI